MNLSDPGSRGVFVSYRHLDDKPPPGTPKDRGFVAYLVRQLRWELSQLGVPDALLWQDRSRIEPGDIWSDAIFKALNNAEFFVAILSCNYITSSWCKTELGTMTSRIAQLNADASQGRIFRVDKNSVPEGDIPESLRRVEPIQFYSADDDEDGISEFYWRGKVRLTEEYEDALNRLARAICKQLKELGIQVGQPTESRPRSSGTGPDNGRVVFVAKPASDMLESYRALIWELQGRGYRVTPDGYKDLNDLGEEARSTVVKALEDAEASIHLLGQRKGGRPDGFDMDLVPMQLAAAADETRKKPDFVRMIWAPKVFLSQTGPEVERDPLKVVEGFGARLDTDQIDGDTASRFTEYVLQRLERLGERRSDPRGGEDDIRLDAPG
jgi:TIR domain